MQAVGTLSDATTFVIDCASTLLDDADDDEAVAVFASSFRSLQDAIIAVRAALVAHCRGAGAHAGTRSSTAPLTLAQGTLARVVEV
jgi:hypothetical protein